MAVDLLKGNKLAVNTEYEDSLPVNMYAVPKKVLMANGYMTSYPGIGTFGQGYGPDRGAVFNDRFKLHFRLTGSQLCTVDSEGVCTIIGEILGSDQATLSGFYSFNTQGIIANNSFFLYDPIGGFREILDPDVGSPIDGIWVDGYYFMTDGEYLFHTEITDEGSVNPLSFSTAEFMPDGTLALGRTQDNKVIVFGRYSVEYFVNVGSENFAFQRLPDRSLKVGVISTHAKIEIDGTHYFVGSYYNQSPAVYILTIQGVIKVSNRRIDTILEKYTDADLTPIRVESRFDRDINFLIIHLPGETLCLNVSILSKLGKEIAWFILDSEDSQDSTVMNYRAINGVFDPRINKWVYGDKYTSDLGLLDVLVASHYMENTPWRFATPLLGLSGFTVHEMELQSIPGFAIESNITIFIATTSDGSVYPYERLVSYGGPSDYGKRFITRVWGFVNDFIGFRFRGLSRSKVTFGLMTLEYTE